MSIVVIWKGFAFWPSMTRVASEMKLQFMVLEMKGKEREALRGTRPVSRHRRDGHVTLKFLRTDSPQVALDDLDVVVARHKLNVHGATDVEGFRDLGRGAFHLFLRLHIKFLGR